MSRMVVASGLHGSFSALRALLDFSRSKNAPLVFVGGAFGFSLHESYVSALKGSAAIALQSQQDLYISDPNLHAWLGSNDIRTCLDFTRTKLLQTDLQWITNLPDTAMFDGRCFYSNAAVDILSPNGGGTAFGRLPGNASFVRGWDGPFMWDENGQVAPLKVGWHNLASLQARSISPSRVVIQGQLGRGFVLYIEEDNVEVREIRFDPSDILDWTAKVPGIGERFWQMLATSAARVKREEKL